MFSLQSQTGADQTHDSPFSDFITQWEKIAAKLGRMRLVNRSRVRLDLGYDGQRAGIAKSDNEPEGTEQAPRHFCRRLGWPNGPHYNGVKAGGFPLLDSSLYKGCSAFANRFKHQTAETR